MKSVRSYLSILLSFCLAASPVAMAGPKEDAREVVASSQQAARDKARMVFHEYLQQAALQASNVLGMADNFNQMSDNLAGQINDLEKLRLQLAQAMEKSDVAPDPDNVDHVLQRMSAVYSTTSDLYVAARAAEKQRDYRILKAGSVAEEIRGSLDRFIDNLQSTCQNGIPANFEYPDLPAVRPIVPSYSFGVNVGVDSGGYTSVQPQVPNVQTKGLKGDTATAVYTTAYAGGFILGAYLVTGHIVLTATAAAALTASQALAATGVGAAVAAVIALVVYFDALFDAISESRDVSDAMWIVFNEKADAETVRSEFKKICRPYAERVANVRDRINAVNANDQQAIADFDAESKEVQAAQEELANLQQAYDTKSVEVKQGLDADPNFAKADDKSKQNEMMKRLASTDELKALKNFINNSQSDFMMKMFDVALMNIGLHSEKVDATMQEKYKELFKKQADQHLAKIVSIAILGRRMAVPKEVRELIQSELQANTRIAYLFRQFDATFANYVHMELTLGQDDGYIDQLKKWLDNVKAAEKEFPASQTLKLLDSRGGAFLQYLGAK